MKRFIEAQEMSYQTALAEIRAGYKSGHWIWYKAPTRNGYSDSSFNEFI